MVASAPDHRVVFLEDTAERNAVADNAVALHTTDTIDMGGSEVDDSAASGPHRRGEVRDAPRSRS